MKKPIILFLLIISVFTVFTINVSAINQDFFVYENPNDPDETIKIPVDAPHLIGTIRFCVEEIQRLPAEINGAICDGDDETFNAKMTELASNITQANSAMSDARMPNRLNLWNVYSILKTKNCGAGTEAQSHADWAREELDRIGQKTGVIEFDNCPYGFQETWKAGEWYYPVWDNANNYWLYYLQNHDVTWEIKRCKRDGSHLWKNESGGYNDYTDTDPEIVRPEDVN